MFTNISWSNYGIAIGLVVLVWYLFLGFRFYYQEMIQIISGKRRITTLMFGNRKTKSAYMETKDKKGITSSLSSSSSEPFEPLEEGK